MARKNYFPWKKVTFSLIIVLVEVAVAVRNLTVKIGDDLEYTGCFSTWNNQRTPLKPSIYDEGFTPESCAEACVNRWGASYKCVYLKGGACRCARKFLFSEKISDTICNISCPMKDLDPRKWPYDTLPEIPCGGNFAYSLYQPGDPDSQGQGQGLDHQHHVEVDVEVTQDPASAEVFAFLESECMTWYIPKDDDIWIDSPDFFSPEISYFPVNSPGDCVQFCGYPLHLSNDPDDLRNATPFAMLFWWSPFLSVCKCASQELRSQLKETPDSNHCSEMCLGDFRRKCGGRGEKVGESWVQYVTVYCIESNATGSHRCQSGPTSPPTSTTTTTEVNELKSTANTGIIPIKTTQQTPVKNCDKVDPNTGHRWIVAPGQTGEEKCKRIFTSSKRCGVAFWHCAGNGTFLTDSPDLSNCSSCWLEKKWQEFDRISNTTAADNLMDSLKTQVKGQGEEDSYIGPDISHILSLGQEVVEKTAQEFDPLYSELVPVVQKIVEVNAYLLQNHPPWNHLSVEDKSKTVTQLISSSESALFHLTEFEDNKENFTANPCENCSTRGNNFLVFAERHQIGKDGVYRFPESFENNKSPAPQRRITLPPGWNQFSHSATGRFLEMAGISVDSGQIGTTMLGHFETKIINGGLISLTVKNRRISGGGIEILFKHDVDAWGQQRSELLRKLHPGEKPKAVQGSARCSFWDTEVNRWSTKGCQLRSSSRFETVCECNHLTAFAVLMDVHQYVGKDFVLEMLTLVLTVASEICLLLTIVLLSYVSIGGLQRIRATIIKNLSVCLMLGNGMVAFVLDRSYFHMTEDVCMASAMITHYIFLAAFMWMLIEGIQLFRMIFHVFDAQRRSYIKHFGVFAYGSPVIVVAVTAMAGYLNGDNPYGGDIYCWLEGAYIWAFMGPVALIITTNLVILIVALKTSFQLEMKKDIRPKFLASKVKSYIDFFRTKFRGCMSLTVVLGLTWSVGYYQLQSNSKGQLAAAYAFTILNASQGIFIFLFNWRIFNEKLKRVSQQMKILPSWFSPDSSAGGGGASGTGTGSSSSGGSPQGGYRHRAKLSVASVQFYGIK